ncbi:MAG: manganese efflux pump MntP family protein [Candidatus Margulisiibacteriota bacterium]
MDILTLVLISVGLAMDATAVSMAYGAIIKKDRSYHALRFALSFGIFQVIMPCIGWLAGSGLVGFISGFDHWVAFGLLFFIGCKMIYGASVIETGERSSAVPLNTLLMLSVATSIDALAVGLSFALLNVNIITPVLIIGAITFAMSLAGFVTGKRVGSLFENNMEKAAGIILILIGFKILAEHIF